jgi:hypothetical protein
MFPLHEDSDFVTVQHQLAAGQEAPADEDGSQSGCDACDDCDNRSSDCEDDISSVALCSDILPLGHDFSVTGNAIIDQAMCSAIQSCQLAHLSTGDEGAVFAIAPPPCSCGQGSCMAANPCQQCRSIAHSVRKYVIKAYNMLLSKLPAHLLGSQAFKSALRVNPAILEQQLQEPASALDRESKRLPCHLCSKNLVQCLARI